MSIYMKSFAVFVICASSVAMVAAAPPAETTDETADIYLNPTVSSEAAFNPTVISKMPPKSDEVSYSCKGEMAIENQSAALVVINHQDVTDDHISLSAENRAMSTRAQLMRRMRETYDNRAGKF